MTPAQIKAQFNEAQACIRNQKPEQAARLLRALLIPTAQAPEVNYQLARALDRLGDTQGAARALHAALQKRPGDPVLSDAALPIFTRAGDSQAVLAIHDARIAAQPNKIAPRADKATYLQNIGEFGKASIILRRLVKRHPDETDLYRLIFFAEKARKGDPLIREMKRLWAHPKLNDAGRMALGFTLAKVHEDIGEPDQVFAYLNAANAAQARQYRHDPDARRSRWAAYKQGQQALDLTPRDGTAPIQPIFVTGTPRSGTTLVEQILSAHSAVTAGGELAHAEQLANAVFGGNQTFADLSKAAPEAFTDFADKYAVLVRRDTGVDSGRVTDKSIQLQNIYGLLAHALPGARFIVVHRDPRDVALSIYKNFFRPGAHRYANDLAAIADMIQAFRDQVTYWKTRMPERIHEVHYEDLVADPEPQTHLLIAAAGLDWEEACLSPHTQTNRVKTLSLAQVRQPIHTGRRDSWRRYEAELKPFIDAWGDRPFDAKEWDA
ncbi:sulfotransferase [Sagittula sp. NFXS13]|uniref:tetratricopeptide repeat-containing sulfotransferase family protein n=1 Tax=Sagittula sp. NFXS13 TaxID=2819095 RepID=UPI0032DF6AFC